MYLNVNFGWLKLEWRVMEWIKNWIHPTSWRCWWKGSHFRSMMLFEWSKIGFSSGVCRWPKPPGNLPQVPMISEGQRKFMQQVVHGMKFPGGTNGPISEKNTVWGKKRKIKYSCLTMSCCFRISLAVFSVKFHWGSFVWEDEMQPQLKAQPMFCDLRTGDIAVVAHSLSQAVRENVGTSQDLVFENQNQNFPSFREFQVSRLYIYIIIYSRGPESFQQCGRVGRTSGDRFPPLWEAFDGLLFGSPIRFGSVLFAIWVLRRADLVAFFSNCQNNFASTIEAHAWQSQAALDSEKTFADTWSCCRSGSIYNPVCGCGACLLSMRLLLDVRGLPGGQRLRAVWAKRLEVCKVGRLALGQDLRSWLWDSWQAAAIRGRQLHGWCE